MKRFRSKSALQIATASLASSSHARRHGMLLQIEKPRGFKQSRTQSPARLVIHRIAECTFHLKLDCTMHGGNNRA
jgi:hypothetical protein